MAEAVTSSGPPRLVSIALRVTITLQTACVLAASITAGIQLTDRDLHLLHSATSYALFTVVLLHLGVATLAWRTGGSARALRAAGLFLAATLAQILLGLTGVRFAHVPLGVLLFGASVLEMSRVWTTPRRSRGSEAAYSRVPSAASRG